MAMTSIRCCAEFSIEGSIAERISRCQTRTCNQIVTEKDNSDRECALLVRFPNVSPGLWQSNVRKHAECELPGHFR